jgi:pimeloyl-ACP methyl ester carboxylesterase
VEVRGGDGSVIAVAVAGEPGAAPLLFCHGLADSRLSARLFAQAARELGWRVLAPGRPGAGGTDPRRLRRVAGWAEDAALVLDAAGAGSAALLGISAGGPFAAACAAAIPGRARRLLLVAPLGPPGWPVRGMAPGQRLSLAAARRAPAFGGWFLGRLAARIFCHLLSPRASTYCAKGVWDISDSPLRIISNWLPRYVAALSCESATVDSPDPVIDSRLDSRGSPAWSAARWL